MPFLATGFVGTPLEQLTIRNARSARIIPDLVNDHKLALIVRSLLRSSYFSCFSEAKIGSIGIGIKVLSIKTYQSMITFLYIHSSRFEIQIGVGCQSSRQKS